MLLRYIHMGVKIRIHSWNKCAYESNKLCNQISQCLWYRLIWKYFRKLWIMKEKFHSTTFNTLLYQVHGRCWWLTCLYIFPAHGRNLSQTIPSANKIVFTILFPHLAMLSIRDWRWTSAITLGWMGATFSGSSSCASTRTPALPFVHRKFRGGQC